ncbi:hypothetical protein D3C72_1753900 [compost metagenome]
MHDFLENLPIRPESHTHRDGGPDPHALEIHRCRRDPRTRLFAELQKILRSQLLHNDEFFSTQARDIGGFIETIADHGGDTGNNHIASQMAVSVIHRFEAVDINEGDAILRIETGAVGVKPQPVVEAGQRVGVAEMQKPLMRLGKQLHFARIDPADDQSQGKRDRCRQGRAEHQPIRKVGHQP